MKDAIFALDERVRYFGFLDNRQGMVISELRNKDESHPGETQLVQDLTFFKGVMASWGIYFGKVRYSVVSHDRFKIMMLPVEGGLIITTTEASLPVDFVETLLAAITTHLGKV